MVTESDPSLFTLVDVVLKEIEAGDGVVDEPTSLPPHPEISATNPANKRVVKNFACLE